MNYNFNSPKVLLAMLLLANIILLALFLRFVNLNSLPVFVDEAIYVRWAQVMKAEPTLRFLPMSDGKQPLFMWVIIPFFKIFSDPLIAGRAVSIFSGIGVIVGIFVLSILLFKSKKVGLLAALMYAVSPYSVFFDRLAMVDSMLAMWGIWTLVFSLLMVKTRRLDTAMLTGFALGAALITKSPALFFIILLPISFLFLNRDNKNKQLSFVYTAFLLLISWGIGLFIFSLLRLGPNFGLIFSRNLDYVHPITQIFLNPTDPFISNFKEYISWIIYFGPYPIIFLLTIALINLKKYFKQYFILGAWAFGSVLIQSEYSIDFTARYVLYTIPFLFVLAASSILVSKKYIMFTYFSIAIFIALSFFRNFMLIANPIEAKMPPGERSGYLEEWTAGFGLKQAAEKIIAIRDANPEVAILVGTEGYFGTLPDGIHIYLEKEKNITVIGIGLGIKKVPLQLSSHKLTGGKAFLVANSSRLEFKNDFSTYGLETLLEFEKPKRPKNTHGSVQYGEYDTFYLFELSDILLE